MFLAGSRTRSDKSISDVDVVVRVDRDEARRIVDALLDGRNVPKLADWWGFRFHQLHLLLCFTDNAYEALRTATDELRNTGCARRIAHHCTAKHLRRLMVKTNDGDEG